MSVEYVKGNLMDFPAGVTVIGHSTNCVGRMGSGVALQIKEEYPAAYEVYEKAHADGELILGTFTVAEVAGGKRVVNLCTQERYGTDRRYVDYEAFYVALRTLRDNLEHAHKEGRVYSLGLPYNISCGTAGGDWKIISAMIHALFDASPVRCVIVEYVKPAAKESIP